MNDGLICAAAWLAPLVLALAARAHALDVRRHGGPPRFFAFAHRVQWLSVAALLGWVASAWPFVAAIGGTSSALPAGLSLPACGLLLLGPPMISLAAMGLMVHDVAKRAELTDWT